LRAWNVPPHLLLNEKPRSDALSYFCDVNFLEDEDAPLEKLKWHAQVRALGRSLDR